MEIFIDTGIFCAVANLKDLKNAETKQKLLSLEEDGNIFFTSDYVLDETYTLIRNRIGHSAAVKFMAEFKKSCIGIKRVSEIIEEEAEKIFIKYADQMFSFTDCTSFAIIEAYNIRGIISLDKDFKRFSYKHAVEFLI